MAVKRMISNSVIHTDDFLKMSQGAQLLYFFLNLSADDDGFNSAPKVEMNICRATEEDLRQLINHRYIIPFESGVIVIRHWLINNQLKEKTYHSTLYMDEKKRLGAGENGEYELIELLPSGSKDLSMLQLEKGKTPLSAKDLMRENKIVQLSLDKYTNMENVKLSLDKLPRGEEEREEKKREEERGGDETLEISENNLYGEMNNVYLLPDEFKNIINEYKKPLLLINKVSYYLKNSERTFNSHYALIQKIAIDDKWERKPIKKETRKEENTNTGKIDEIKRIMEEKEIGLEEAEKIYNYELQEARKRVMDKIGKIGE